jgi:hypothetical protein
MIVFLTLDVKTMDTKNSNNNQSDGSKQYFKSWNSYQIPLKPSGPIGYEETESLTSYYLGWFGNDNELLKFTKFLKQSESVGFDSLDSISQVQGIMYYRAKKSLEGVFIREQRIEYVQTEGISNYFKGTIEQNKNVIKLELIRINSMFDEYSYWPNGKLKSRRMSKENGDIMYYSYDEEGKEIK